MIAQAVIVFIAVVIFARVLTIAGGIPTSNLAEHPPDGGNATATPAPGDDDAATATPAPEVDDMIAQPDMDVRSLPVIFLRQRVADDRIIQAGARGTVAFDVWSDAPGDLEVWLFHDGERVDRLLGNDCDRRRPVIERIATAGPYFLDVTADGEWQINVSQVEAGIGFVAILRPAPVIFLYKVPGIDTTVARVRWDSQSGQRRQTQDLSCRGSPVRIRIARFKS